MWGRLEEKRQGWTLPRKRPYQPANELKTLLTVWLFTGTWARGLHPLLLLTVEEEESRAQQQHIKGQAASGRESVQGDGTAYGDGPTVPGRRWTVWERSAAWWKRWLCPCGVCQGFAVLADLSSHTEGRESHSLRGGRLTNCYHTVIALFLKGGKDYVVEFDAMEGIRGNRRGVVLCTGKLDCVNDGMNAQPEARSRRWYKAYLLNRRFWCHFI